MVTIQIVTWNSRDVLPGTLAALKEVPPSQAVIRFIDNHSSDGTRDYIAATLPAAEIISLPQNIGFAAAHNVGFAKCTTPFVLTCDPDLAINWEGLLELLEVFSDDSVGAVQGKLLRQQTESVDRAIIDSAGIYSTWTLNGAERGAGEVDLGQYNAPAVVDAVTGAYGLYRMSALQVVAHGTEIFDEDFFAYKEDVDLGWRLRRAGFTCRYEPVVAGTHRRTMGVGTEAARWGGSLGIFYRRLKNVRTHYSLRNYIWMLVKNISFPQAIVHDIPIAGRLAIFVLFTLFYPPLLMAWLQALQGMPSMIQKRVIKSV